jgi:hypothetical protein
LDLRQKLEFERKNSKWAQSDKAKRLIERSELEDLFLACVEEVRKDIVKRRATSATYSNKKNPLQKSVSSRSLEKNQALYGGGPYQDQ